MDFTTATSRSQLTISDIEDYRHCGLFYKFSRIDGLEMNPIPDELVIQKVIRNVLKNFSKSRMAGKEWSMMDLRGEFTSRWEQETTGKIVDYRPGMNLKKALGTGRNLLEAFYVWFPWKGYEIISVSEPFIFKIDGVEVPIVGEFDLIEQMDLCTAIITDFKDSSSLCSIDQMDTDLRLTLLHMAALMDGYGYAGMEILIRSVHMIRTKSPRIAPFLTRKTGTDIQRAIQLVRAVWDGISKGVFIPNPGSWKCNQCGYKCECKAWFGL
jgi:hypothetical protein